MLCWEQAGVQIRTHYPGRKRRGWPGGRHASPTELKMRSRITTFSVNFSAFPAKQSLQLLAKSVRPRAKSFIRPISEIGANAKKCYHWMTSEVRKCPKSAKSDRNSGFLLGVVKRREVTYCNVKMKCAHGSGGSNLLLRNDSPWRHHLHFWEIMIFFQQSISRSKNNSGKLSINNRNPRKVALWTIFYIAFILSVWRITKSKLRNTFFFIKRVYFQKI